MKHELEILQEPHICVTYSAVEVLISVYVPDKI